MRARNHGTTLLALALAHAPAAFSADAAFLPGTKPSVAQEQSITDVDRNEVPPPGTHFSPEVGEEGVECGNTLDELQATKYPTVYEKDLTANGFQNGFAKVIYSGSKGFYVGYVRAGKRHGCGKHEWSSGASYTGQWVNGVRTGQGALERSDGHIYIGDHINNKETGFGIINYKSGVIYSGYVTNSKPDGAGTIYFMNGNLCTGLWSDGRLQGKGHGESSRGDRVRCTESKPNTISFTRW